MRKPKRSKHNRIDRRYTQKPKHGFISRPGKIFFTVVQLQINFKGLIYGPSPDEQKRTCLQYIAEHFPNVEAHEINIASESFESVAEHFNPDTILVVYNKHVLFRLGISENPIHFLSEKGIKVIFAMTDSDPQIDFANMSTIYLDNVNRASFQIPKPYIDESLSSLLSRFFRRPEYKAEIENRFRMFHRQMIPNISIGNSESDLDTADDEDTVDDE